MNEPTPIERPPRKLLLNRCDLCDCPKPEEIPTTMYCWGCVCDHSYTVKKKLKLLFDKQNCVL